MSLIYRAVGWAVLLFLLLAACTKDTAQVYEQVVWQSRFAKNDRLLVDKDSPLTAKQKRDFVGLHYYQVNSDYVVEAILSLKEQPDTVDMPNTAGQVEPYLHLGQAGFSLMGEKCSLEVFVAVDTAQGLVKRLFIPFYDPTNEAETYGGGRYIYPDYHGGKEIELDFNMALNPYCSYNPAYACPIPPKNNRLAVQIKAGEKDFVQP